MMVALCLIAMLAAGAMAEQAPPHPKTYWQEIARTKYAVPPGASAVDLLRELSTYVGSADPEMRDDLAYNISVAWIFRQRLVGPDDLRPLMRQWTANLRNGVGERGTDLVLRRSFSALNLATIAALDNEAPLLTDVEFRELLSSALAYLDAERDLRGFDAQKGWMHATAHTADLLKFLGRSRRITPADQAAILQAIARKLQGADLVFTHGEDERLARTALSLLAREDVDRTAAAAWLTGLATIGHGDEVTEATLCARQNVKNFVANLHIVLTLDTRTSPTLTEMRSAVREVLAKVY